ncbi:Anti-sigma factor antagonist [Desulfonema limicola]|uniref:Anti-sigma factor antagonist n=1 Tax=Desulfonema limicola TaxID=45656 RepID=A0A975GEF3_9BACT|nr:STAS domain-containing protein [Desulfonema limicola]QTA78148.1 Anti-sigma factor antagonist [Desulfonema limicola]
MNIKVNAQGYRIDINISGSVDQFSAKTLKTEFEKLQLSQVKEIIINMDQVTYIGSAGVGKLLLLYKNFSARDGKISIINLSEDIYDMLTNMELGEIFNLTRKP